MRCKMITTLCVCYATPADKKRRRSAEDSLTRGSCFDERYAGKTHTQWMLHEGNVSLTSEKITTRQKRATKAAQTRWSNFVEDDEGTLFENLGGGKLGPGMSAARRTTISFFFIHHFGSPPETRVGRPRRRSPRDHEACWHPRGLEERDAQGARRSGRESAQRRRI